MTDLLSRKTLVLAAKETTYGTAATIAGSNAILCSNAELTPLAGGTVNRDFYRDYLGASPEIHVGSHVTLAFDVELAGGGAVDTPPPWGVLLKGCGFAETITPTTGPVEYDPISASFDSLTIDTYIDGQKHRLTGARGTFSLNLASKQIPKLRFTFTGIYNAPATASPPTADYSAFQAPIPASNANTPTFTLHQTSTYRLYDLSIDIGNQIQHEDIVNEEVVLLTDRMVKGSITMAAEVLSTFNAFSVAKANTLDDFQLVHGTASGNIVTIDAPKIQLLDPKYGDANGRRTVQANLAFTPSSGNDEIKFTTN